MISAVFILYIGRQFVIHTGIDTQGVLYFVISLAGFLGIYVFYFMLTYLQFVKNILQTRKIIVYYNVRQVIDTD